jgi:hypothetical protein
MEAGLPGNTCYWNLLFVLLLLTTFFYIGGISQASEQQCCIIGQFGSLAENFMVHQLLACTFLDVIEPHALNYSRPN